MGVAERTVAVSNWDKIFTDGKEVQGHVTFFISVMIQYPENLNAEYPGEK